MATNSYDSIIKSAINQANNDQGPFGPDLHGSILENWIYPGLVEEREFGQQVALQQMQNEWNAAPNQMEQMKKAGINANVAAAGIAGAGNAPSAGSPNSAVGTGAAGVGAAAQLGEAGVGVANAFTAGKANLAAADASSAKAELDRATAKNVDALARAQIMEKVGVLADYFENNGADSIRAAQLAITLGSGDWQTVLNILSADDKIRKYDHQIKLLDNEAKNEEKRWHVLNQQIETMKAQAGEATANAEYLTAKKEHEDVLKGLDQRRTEIYDGLRKDPYFDQWQSLVWYRDKFGYDSAEYKQALSIVKDSVYWSHKGANMAEIEDGYRKAFEELKAKADVDADFSPYFAAVEANKQGLIELLKFVYDNPDDFGSIVGKFITYISSFGTSLDVIHGRVNNAKKPISGSPNSGRW